MTPTPFVDEMAGLKDEGKHPLNFSGFLHKALPEVAGSNPASPISRFSRKVVFSEEVPKGWWGSWVGQFAMESLSNAWESYSK